MSANVSIIIPCFNAERWLGEAIESCLSQTHGPLEIIVVDDGSVDGSVQIIKSFGARVRWVSGPNHGGNYARNKGCALSNGDYIQFLDADDYLLPDKISSQLECFQRTGADVVYSDWRHQFHRKDDTVELEDVTVAGDHEDILESLLKSWWVSPAALLFHRDVVQKVGGWDESLSAAQDRDFFISVALTGARIVYQPGCHAIYRRHGPSVSTSNLSRWLDSHWRVLRKAEATLQLTGRLTPNYRRALAWSYFGLARNYFEVNRLKYNEVVQKVLELDPQFRPQQSRIYDFVQGCLGYRAADFMASWKRRLSRLRGADTKA